jgi:hypothetical protein
MPANYSDYFSPALTRASRELLEGTIEIIEHPEVYNGHGLDDIDGLVEACSRVLAGMATEAHMRRVLRHCYEDDFDYLSNDADDCAVELESVMSNFGA